MDYYLIVFESTHGAISTQKYLEKEFKITIMPVLREISSSCGISIRVMKEDYENVVHKMNEFSLEKNMYHFYYVSQDGIKKCTSAV